MCEFIKDKFEANEKAKKNVAPFAVKDMPQVAAAARTYNFDSRHEERRIDVCGNAAFDALVERGPARGRSNQKRIEGSVKKQINEMEEAKEIDSRK